MNRTAETERAGDYDPYWDYDDNDCANCGGDGFTFGCSWDWQCDTWDAGEGTCLCTRPCEWCNPVKPAAALQQILAAAIERGDHIKQEKQGGE